MNGSESKSRELVEVIRNGEPRSINVLFFITLLDADVERTCSEPQLVGSVMLDICRLSIDESGGKKGGSSG